MEQIEQPTQADVYDVIEDQIGQPKVFLYKFTTPTNESKIVAVVACSSTDAKDGLKARLPPESVILRVETHTADIIVQV